MLNRLRHIRKVAHSALELLERGGIMTAEHCRELRDIVVGLKSEIRVEYKRTSAISVQEKMSPEELAHYLPAIHEAYGNTGLRTLRAEKKPTKDWYWTIKAVNAKVKYYLDQVESQNE